LGLQRYEPFSYLQELFFIFRIFAFINLREQPASLFAGCKGKQIFDLHKYLPKKKHKCIYNTLQISLKIFTKDALHRNRKPNPIRVPVPLTRL
jgi:hypothetical protein